MDRSKRSDAGTLGGFPPSPATDSAGQSPASSTRSPADILAALDRNEFAWEPFQPGVEIHRLSGDPGGASTALLRYAPGARVALHRHEDVEEIHVLRGSQRDERGVYPAGSHVFNPAGSAHTVESPEGCVALLIWRKHNTFLGGSDR